MITNYSKLFNEERWNDVETALDRDIAKFEKRVGLTFEVASHMTPMEFISYVEQRTKAKHTN